MWTTLALWTKMQLKIFAEQCASCWKVWLKMIGFNRSWTEIYTNASPNCWGLDDAYSSSLPHHTNAFSGSCPFWHLSSVFCGWPQWCSIRFWLWLLLVWTLFPEIMNSSVRRLDRQNVDTGFCRHCFFQRYRKARCVHWMVFNNCLFQCRSQ